MEWCLLLFHFIDQIIETPNTAVIHPPIYLEKKSQTPTTLTGAQWQLYPIIYEKNVMWILWAEKTWEVFVPHPQLWKKTVKLRKLLCDVLKQLSQKTSPIKEENCDKLQNVKMYYFCTLFQAGNFWTVYVFLLRMMGASQREVQYILWDCEAMSALKRKGKSVYDTLEEHAKDCLDISELHTWQKHIEKMSMCEPITIHLDDLEPHVVKSLTTWPDDVDEKWKRFQEKSSSTPMIFNF